MGFLGLWMRRDETLEPLEHRDSVVSGVVQHTASILLESLGLLRHAPLPAVNATFTQRNPNLNPVTEAQDTDGVGVASKNKPRCQ